MTLEFNPHHIKNAFDPSTKWNGHDGNWDANRPHGPLAVVMHKTGYAHDTVEGVLSWFHNRRSTVSAHYLVGYDGDVYEVVPPRYVAYHAGGSSRLTVRGKTYANYQVNTVTIGIEVLGASGEPYSEVQKRIVPELVAWLCEAYGISPDDVVGHAGITPTKSDGMEYLEQIRARVAGGARSAVVANGVPIDVPEFAQFFDCSGGVHTFGYPLAPATEIDGRRVQFFERYVMELFPENAPPWNVQGWLLGREEYIRRGP